VKNQTSVIVGSATLGLLAGFGVITGAVNFKTVSIAGMLALPTAFVTHLISDTQATKRINQSEERVKGLERELEKAMSQATFLEDIEARSQHLAIEIDKVRSALDLAIGEHQKASDLNLLLQQSLSALQADLEASQGKVEELQAECEAWEEEFTDRVESAADAKFQIANKAEIQKIFDEHDAITSQAMQLFQELQQWGQKVAHGHTAKREIIQNLARSYNENLLDFGESVKKEHAAHVAHVEDLNERIAMLQQQLAGDLIAPEYGKFGYQWDARIADDIARHIWQSMHIPLAVKGFKSNPDGTAEAGYAYSRSHPIEALQRDLNRLSGDIAKSLGIHAIESIKKHDLSDLLIIGWRCERPKPIAEDAFYRIVAPASACTKLLREALDHKKGGKPTLRIMGATGEGKGIIAKILLADWVKSESGEIWLSDPMDGSDEDRWEVPKAAKSSREARQLLKEFEGEFRRRKDKVSDRKDVPVVGLFDEFDKEHPRDDKDLVKSIWTAIRHHKMKLILMGQSSEVGSNGWQWDEMKNCACLFVGSGITTAIKHAKDLGLSRAIASQLESQNDQIQNWLESKNQGLDAANQYRVGLLVCSDKAQFIEFPPAHKGAIERDKSVIVSHPWKSVSTDEKVVVTELKVCPGCGGKLRKAGSKLRCENRSHTKDMGLKTFSIDG